jgi:hypothetical protein
MTTKLVTNWSPGDSYSPLQSCENWRDYLTEEGLEIMEVSRSLYFTLCRVVRLLISLRSTRHKIADSAPSCSRSEQEGNEIKYQGVCSFRILHHVTG